VFKRLNGIITRELMVGGGANEVSSEKSDMRGHKTSKESIRLGLMSSHLFVISHVGANWE